MQGVELFDNVYFAISRGEASVIDPQQRALLESSNSALHSDRGAPLSTLRATGVYLGAWAGEYADAVNSSPAFSSIYYLLGTGGANMAGRISFCLDLRGPCLAVDTACSSSLVATHLAARGLQHRECEVGLTAGANIIFSAAFCARIARAGMTSPRGRSHTFDRRADGYARGEASVAVALRLLKDDVHGTPGHGTWRGAAVRQDGRTASMTAPSGTAQQVVIASARLAAGLTVHLVHSVEAHGTGTSLGDPIEVGALCAVQSKVQSAAMGGVKANAGHAEPVAGLLGLVAVVAIPQRLPGIMPNAQLRAINRYVASAVSGSLLLLPVHLICQQMEPVRHCQPNQRDLGRTRETLE